MNPSSYASRYLPISIPNGKGLVPVHIRRYHLGQPTPAQQRLWGALGDHFRLHKRDPRYQLTLTVNGSPFSVKSRDEIRMPAVRPFWGKGSPEDCQVVLQLAVMLNLLGGKSPQTWADENLGVDCNGFAGNYLFHTQPFTPWWTSAGAEQTGPSQTIDKLFRSVAGQDERGAVLDLDDLDPKKTHIIVRTDPSGRVIPGPSPVGHVALTEPGQFKPSYSSMDLTRARDGMIGNPAIMTVESAGPVKGVGTNWMVFLRPLKPKGVFEVTRDNIRKIDTVKLAPLPSATS